MIIVKSTVIYPDRVLYVVLAAEDHPEYCSCGTAKQRVLWVKQVNFGKDRPHRAGGKAFQDAARAQDKAATQALKNNDGKPLKGW